MARADRGARPRARHARAVLLARCPRAGCRGSLWRDASGVLVCLSCARPADSASDPLPLVSELLLRSDGPDEASQAAALAGQELSVEDEQRARTRSLNAASAMRYRDRKAARRESAYNQPS